ncbi:hypothetical protein [Lichenibacterium ramalinae]|uniref:Uncharacterized protein n=1 Tax=Lichenibacterium ramalinae TaxID=2316527 RepID=A0A4V1RIT7_9HYPH|nr:hypothetical protein [Lichenibacterium ramalinae]RYB05607.1 hypothetical protein D3272_08330 [Lichenibacterium ramalinae]
MFPHRRAALALLLSVTAAAPALAQGAPTAPEPPPGTVPAVTPALAPALAPTDRGMTTLTIFFKHDESQTLGEINARLHRQHFYESFPPPGVEVLSWNVLMGVGQVVTLRFPAERLREVNRAVEQTAWGGYHTEFYPTYDYRPTASKEREGLPSSFK